MDQAASALHDFEEQVDSGNLDQEVASIVTSPEYLTPTQVDSLMEILLPMSDISVGYGAGFDIKDEINDQIAMVRAMRRDVISSDGRVKTGKTTRDLKEVISASTTLTTLLMKSHETILNHDRQRAMETAMKSAIETLDKDAQDVFFLTLEGLLEEIE